MTSTTVPSRPHVRRLRIRAAAPLAALLVLGMTPPVCAQFWQAADFSAHFNLRWQSDSRMTRVPTGCVEFGGVPFIIPVSGPNAWSAYSAAGANPRSINIPVQVDDALEVHTLINTLWGRPGPVVYASLEFFGSGGAYHRKDLVGNVDIRDYLNNNWTNGINGTTTVQVWTYSGARLDKQRIALPPAFMGQRLQTIRLSDSGGTNFQRVVLYGVTIASAANPCYPDCEQGSCPGLLDVFDFLCFQNRFAALDPYACDCDTAGGPLVCDIFDFLCFQNAFAAGCP